MLIICVRLPRVALRCSQCSPVNSRELTAQSTLNKSCGFIWNGYNLDGFRIKYGMTPHRITVWTYLVLGKYGLHRRSGDG